MLLELYKNKLEVSYVGFGTEKLIKGEILLLQKFRNFGKFTKHITWSRIGFWVSSNISVSISKNSAEVTYPERGYKKKELHKKWNLISNILKGKSFWCKKMQLSK